ncbi:MAG: nucleotide exchange factor GrpE [Patescibacteria group bacterium]|nr:nucleotide exchange factor GrpE [Patescibacteria group bacterium]
MVVKDHQHKDKKPNPDIQKIKELEQQIQDLKNGWQRTQADFENFRKRAEGLKSEWIKMANTDLMLKVLPVMDNFRRANQHTPQNLKDDNWVIGIKQIEKQLENILSEEGLKKIETKSGDEFDHNLHEAISYEENKELPENKIIEVTEEGYQFTDKVLRPAKVRVSKGLDKM